MRRARRRPRGSTTTLPAGRRTTRRSSPSGPFPRHPTHVRSGDAMPDLTLPAGASRRSATGPRRRTRPPRRRLGSGLGGSAASRLGLRRRLAAAPRSAGSATGSAAGGGPPRRRDSSRDLGLGLDVDPPSGQPRGQAGVLPLLADGERQLVVGHDDQRRAVAGVDPDLFHLGGLQRVRDQLGRVRAPRHHVDLLAAELVHHHADARALRAHARADRIDARLVATTRRSSSGVPARARPP